MRKLVHVGEPLNPGEEFDWSQHAVCIRESAARAWCLHFATRFRCEPDFSTAIAKHISCCSPSALV